MDLTVRYFLIKVTLKDKSVHYGVRETEHSDIDLMFLLCRNKAHESYGADKVIDFQCVQLSKHSDEVKDHLRKKAAGAKVRKIR